MFIAGHTYRRKDSNSGNIILCVGVHKYSAVFRMDNSYSIKRFDKEPLYEDLGVTSLKGYIYNLLG